MYLFWMVAQNPKHFVKQSYPLTCMQLINVTLARNLFCSLIFLLNFGTPLVFKSVSFGALKKEKSSHKMEDEKISDWL